MDESARLRECKDTLYGALSNPYWSYKDLQANVNGQPEADALHSLLELPPLGSTTVNHMDYRRSKPINHDVKVSSSANQM